MKTATELKNGWWKFSSFKEINITSTSNILSTAIYLFIYYFYLIVFLVFGGGCVYLSSLSSLLLFMLLANRFRNIVKKKKFSPPWQFKEFFFLSLLKKNAVNDLTVIGSPIKWSWLLCKKKKWFRWIH